MDTKRQIGATDDDSVVSRTNSTGTLAATVFGVFLVPSLCAVFRRLGDRGEKDKPSSNT